MSMNEPNETGEQWINDGSAASEAGDATGEPAPEELPQLASTLVRYDGEPDQVTVYPPGMSSIERMSTWITVDADDCLEPSEMR
jgi:hypothetical protein